MSKVVVVDCSCFVSQESNDVNEDDDDGSKWKEVKEKKVFCQ
jgi:hypothetical protein